MQRQVIIGLDRRAFKARFQPPGVWQRAAKINLSGQNVDGGRLGCQQAVGFGLPVRNKHIGQ